MHQLAKRNRADIADYHTTRYVLKYQNKNQVSRDGLRSKQICNLAQEEQGMSVETYDKQIKEPYGITKLRY